jgi:hypothetical protein
MLEALRATGATASLDLGIDCGVPKRFVASVGLEPDDLRFLADLGVGFDVTAYPYDERFDSPQK